MLTLTLKNIPDELHRRLKARAERNHRSLNREAIRILEEATDEDVAGGRIDPQAFLEVVRRNREAMAAQGVWLTEESLREAVEEGRP